MTVGEVLDDSDSCALMETIFNELLGIARRAIRSRHLPYRAPRLLKSRLAECAPRLAAPAQPACFPPRLSTPWPRRVRQVSLPQPRLRRHGRRRGRHGAPPRLLAQHRPRGSGPPDAPPPRPEPPRSVTPPGPPRRCRRSRLPCRNYPSATPGSSPTRSRTHSRCTCACSRCPSSPELAPLFSMAGHTPASACAASWCTHDPARPRPAGGWGVMTW